MEDQMNNSSNAVVNCSANDPNANDTSDCGAEIDFPKTATLLIIFIVALIGNVCTITVMSRFKQHKLPDVLVIGLAGNDLITTFIPVLMSLYSYITLRQFTEGSFACKFYGTVAQFTRYTSALIVTLISLERYFAVNRPFIYRKYATPTRCVLVLVCCWIMAFGLAVAPALDNNTRINSHDGFCLFDFSSNYAISILVYAGVQFCIVLVCFVLVTVNLLKVYRRRKELRVQGNYNQRSQAMEREHEVTFTKPRLTSRISDIAVTLKKAAPLITEKFQLGVEAQFARMLFAVVALFYVSWTTLVILIMIAQVQRSEHGLSLALFWGIRLSVVSVAINPLLYGLLARQYLMAYVYVLRRMFSFCCSCCVYPPPKNIFTTARTVGGDLQGDTRQAARERKKKYEKQYGSHSNRSMNGSIWSTRTGQPVLTRTTHVSLGLLPQLNEEDFLSVIKEETNEHSTFIPSVGELSSTVVIPHQARGDYEGTPTLNQKHIKTTSASNLTDYGYEQDESDTHTGLHNPLAIVVDIEGEAAVTQHTKKRKQFPPFEAIDGHDLDTGKVYNNPVYEMERRKRRKEEARGGDGGGVKEPLRLSQSSPLSFLRASQREKLRATHTLPVGLDDATGSPQHTPNSSPETGEKSRLAPTKKPVEVTRSSPLAFLRGSKKKKKLQASLTLPPTLHPDSTDEGAEPGVTSLDEIDNIVREVEIGAQQLVPPPAAGHRQARHATRASARTYHEMQRKMNPKLPSRPISSSHSFTDSPLADSRSIGTMKEESEHASATHDSAIGLSPQHQLSLSPIPPPHTHPTITTTTTSHSPVHSSQPHISPSSSSYSTTSTTLHSTPPHPPPSPREQPLPSTNMSPPASSLTRSQPAYHPNQHLTSHTQSSHLPVTRSKNTVQELRLRFESISSTPPTSPTSLSFPSHPSSSSPLPTSTTHHHCTETDSGRESMVELVTTDIDSSAF